MERKDAIQKKRCEPSLRLFLNKKIERTLPETAGTTRRHWEKNTEFFRKKRHCTRTHNYGKLTTSFHLTQFFK